MQKYAKKNPEYKVNPQAELNTFEVIFKVANQSLLKYKLLCNSKNEAKKIVAFLTLQALFPQAYSWILIHNLPKVENLRKIVNLSKRPFSSAKNKNTDLMSEIYKKFNGEISELKVKQYCISENTIIDHESIWKNYQSSLDNGVFSMTASKIHQRETKQSLKLNQKHIEKGKYEVRANCGSDELFSLVVSCQNNTIAKNLAGLKFIELYCFPAFKNFYEEQLGKTCPEPSYIKDIQKYNLDRKKRIESQNSALSESDQDSLTNSQSNEDDTIIEETNSDQDLKTKLPVDSEEYQIDNESSNQSSQAQQKEDLMDVLDQQIQQSCNRSTSFSDSSSVGAKDSVKRLDNSSGSEEEKVDNHSPDPHAIETPGIEQNPSQLDDINNYSYTSNTAKQRLKNEKAVYTLNQKNILHYRPESQQSETLIHSNYSSTLIEDRSVSNGLNNTSINSSSADSINQAFNDHMSMHSVPNQPFKTKEDQHLKVSMGETSFFKKNQNITNVISTTQKGELQQYSTQANIQEIDGKNNVLSSKQTQESFNRNNISNETTHNPYSLQLAANTASYSNPPQNVSMSQTNFERIPQYASEDRNKISIFTEGSGYTNEDLHQLASGSETDSDDESSDDENLESESKHSIIELYSRLYDMLRARKYKFVASSKSIIKSQKIIKNWENIPDETISQIFQGENFIHSNLLRLLQYFQIEKFHVQSEPQNIPEQIKKNQDFNLTVTIVLTISGIPNQVIQYSGLCRTKKRSRFQDILTKDSIMVLLREVLPMAFHKLQIKLVEDMLKTKAKSYHSSVSSTSSEVQPKMGISSVVNSPTNIYQISRAQPIQLTNMSSMQQQSFIPIDSKQISKSMTIPDNNQPLYNNQNVLYHPQYTNTMRGFIPTQQIVQNQNQQVQESKTLNPYQVNPNQDSTVNYNLLSRSGSEISSQHSYLSNFSSNISKESCSTINETPLIISAEEVSKKFQFVNQEFKNCTIDHIEYWKDKAKKYKISSSTFLFCKKKEEFISGLNNLMRIKDWASLLNHVLQKGFQAVMDIQPRNFKEITLIIRKEPLIRIKVNYSNKKEAKKLASLIILRILCKRIYYHCQTGKPLKEDTFFMESSQKISKK